MSVILSGGKILGSGAGVFSIGGGGGGGNQPQNVRVISQGGGNNANSGNNQSNTSYYAIQWDPVASATGYNIYRSVSGGAYTLYASNVQPQTWTASTAANAPGAKMTVTVDGTGGNIVPGTDLTGAATGITAGTAISDRYTGANQNGTTTGTGGTGTYPLNINQTLTSRSFTVCVFIDTAATNCCNPDDLGPNTIYDYNVSAIVSGVEGTQSDDMSLWFYKAGYTFMHGLQSLPTAEEVSFGTPNSVYDSTACAGLGWPLCWAYDVSQGLQPGSDTPLCPEWTVELGAFKYCYIDFMPGTTYTGWALDGVGSVSRVPSGDLFGLLPQFNGFAYAQGTIAANIITTLKIPMGVFGMTRNTFTGTISNGSGGSGSTCSVTAVGSGLFGATGTFDRSGFITGTGIPAGSWVNSNITGGTGPGGSGPGSTWGIFSGTGAGSPINVNITSDGTWTYARTTWYKGPIYSLSIGASHTSYFNNFRFGRK